MNTSIEEVQQVKQVYYDLIFHHLFGNEKNIEFTKYLLKTLFEYKEQELENMRIANTKLLPDNVKQKKYDTDILLYLNDGRIINIEAYYKPSEKSYRKSEMYVYKILTKNFKVSDDYDEIKKVTQYNFIKKGKMSRSDNVTLFGTKDRLNNDYSPKKLYDIVEINVDRIKGKMSKKKKNLIDFLNAEDESDMEKIAKKDEMIKNMFEELKRFCQSGELSIPGYTKGDLIIESLKEEIAEEAMEKGIEKEKHDTIIEMLKDSMPVDKISKYTRISIEDILKIKNEK